MTAIIKWEDSQQMVEVKKLFAPNLNDNEFQTFVWIWKATGLNPFLREIWAVKFWTNPASIFIWRDWYRKSAQANKEYDYHIVDAVYQNDNFEVDNWEVKHKYNFTNRWELVGAYCIVKRKSSSKAMFNFVNLIEYYLWNRVIKDWKITDEVKKKYDWKLMWETIWDTKPATMIKKVAEAQWLRGTFQELFAWTYDESEEIEIKDEKPVINQEDQEKNFSEYEEKFMCIKNEDDLKKLFLELNKKRKENPNFINKEQLDELVKLKDDIKEKLKTPEVQEEIQDGEVETTNEVK